MNVNVMIRYKETCESIYSLIVFNAKMTGEITIRDRIILKQLENALPQKSINDIQEIFHIDEKTYNI